MAWKTIGRQVNQPANTVLADSGLIGPWFGVIRVMVATSDATEVDLVKYTANGDVQMQSIGVSGFFTFEYFERLVSGEGTKLRLKADFAGEAQGSLFLDYK